jgi:HlyD family secretion protein
MNRTSVVVILAVGAVAVGGGWHHFHASSEPVQLATAEVASGDIVQSVACTGTLDAVTTIDVGSQVSGRISVIPVDFNSIVRKGDVLAKLDVSLFQAELDQARASLAVATADVGVAQAALIDATEKLDRSKALAARQLIPQSDFDTAQVTADQAKASVKSAIAQQQMAQASVDQAQVDLEHAVILSPIDGIVVARKVDVGQTVAASFQTSAR